MNMYFLLSFLLTISPRKSTQSVHQIVQFQSQNAKAPSSGPPPARALRALLAFSLQYWKSCPPRKQSCVRPCVPYFDTNKRKRMTRTNKKTKKKKIRKFNLWTKPDKHAFSPKMPNITIFNFPFHNHGNFQLFFFIITFLLTQINKHESLVACSLSE